MSQQNRKKSQDWDSHNFISNGIFKSMYRAENGTAAEFKGPRVLRQGND